MAYLIFVSSYNNDLSKQLLLVVQREHPQKPLIAIPNNDNLVTASSMGENEQPFENRNVALSLPLFT